LGEDIAAYNNPDRSVSDIGKKDGKFGAAYNRAEVRGSPVCPESAVKVHELGDQIMYSIVVLKGHYQAGGFEIQDESAKFVPGESGQGRSCQQHWHISIY
jgi:hypothetical protein